VFFPTTDVIGKLAAGQLLQPLNKSCIPNLPNVWESLQDPFNDKGSVYSVPYVLFQTGIGYRIDGVAKAPDAYANPYDIFWDTANSGQVYLLEDDREVFGMALLRMSPDNDVNTEDEELIAAALEDVMELTDAVNVKVGAEAYTVLPEKRTWVHQCWSGDVVNAQYYLPEGESIDNIGYWYPAGGGGVIGSDTIAVMRDAEKPVLAHMFLNFLLDTALALENYGWLGYQPPQNSIDPETVVADGYVPAHLSSAVIKPEDFDTGHQLLQLSLAGEKIWDNDVQRRWLTTSAPPPEGRGTGTGRAVCGRRWPHPACCGWCCCSSCRSTACWPSPSAASTRSSATPCRCGTPSTGTSRRSRRSSSGSSPPSSDACSCARSSTSSPPSRSAS
jgi:spermidine/putrescine transport system substrate-binding protein